MAATKIWPLATVANYANQIHIESAKMAAAQ